MSSPIATFSDGALVTITFTATCSPALGTTITAPVAFSNDPAATFSQRSGSGCHRRHRGRLGRDLARSAGDCNGTGVVTAADLIAETLEIFDNDGTFWADAPGSTFVGSPVGCDANDDTAINAGDVAALSCASSTAPVARDSRAGRRVRT